MGAKLYAIYAGAGGFTGVVKGSNRARELTQGVAGAKQRACDTREQAERFINFHIRRAGVRGWNLEDIEAAAAEPIEVQEGAAEAKAEAQEEPYGQAFWESAQRRLRQAASEAEAIAAVAEICDRYGIDATSDVATFIELTRLAGIAEQGQ